VLWSFDNPPPTTVSQKGTTVIFNSDPSAMMISLKAWSFIVLGVDLGIE
jgi:hypothetical protein